MCGRYALFQPQPEIERRFSAHPEINLAPRYNVAPETDIPVVRNEAPDEIDAAEWGFVAPWDHSKRLINARSETASEKATFKSAFADRRCLVPASGYYEWQKRPKGQKQPYLIQRGDGDLFAFAGLWNPANGVDHPTVTILTTEPAESIEHIHDRMPVVLERDDEEWWLEADDVDELQGLLHPYPSDQLDATAISTMVNDPSKDGPELIEPVETDQAGLDGFGRSG